MITAGWLQRRIEKREQRIRSEGIAEGIAEGTAEGIAKVLAVLDEEARKDAERKLNLNGNSDSKN